MGMTNSIKRLLARFHHNAAVIQPSQTEWLRFLRDMTPATPNPYPKRSTLPLSDTTAKRTFGDV
ncbi:MAG: hypothetical protein HZA24_09550 [Nitrospirae bacterium]|nr:hypothetical protein [Nitrospirota bacterium]